MLLSRDAIATAMEMCKPDDFYKQSHGLIFSAITSLFSQGEPADWVTVTEELRRRGLLEAIGDPSVFVSLQANTPSIGNAELLRLDHRGARPAPSPGVGGRGDQRAGLLRPRRRGGGPGPGRDTGLRRGPAPGDRLDDPAPRPAGPEPRPSPAAVQPGGDHHRPGHRLRRPRRAAGRAPAVQPHRGGGPARHGEDRLRPRHGGPRRHRAEQARAPVLPRDEPSRADPAPPQLRGPGGRQPDADGQAPRGRLVEDRQRHQPDERGADLHRRQPQPDGDGHPGPGPPAEEPRGARASWSSTTCS